VEARCIATTTIRPFAAHRHARFADYGEEEIPDWEEAPKGRRELSLRFADDALNAAAEAT
jgi:hypothetical protein